ncbi:MAG: 1,4-alpha-glucan branching protein domain-containing protein [Candidatus Hydrogenedentota bacterium]
MAKQGFLCFVLHAHLPFIRHPEYEDFLEEDWFYEAITETYVPLLDSFEKLINEGVDFRITMSITPPLISMLRDELLQSRYIKRIEKLIELAEKEVHRTRFIPEFHSTALMYLDKFRKCRYMFVDKYKRDLTLGFKRIQDAGNLHIVTCCATHGFLPLMGINRNAVAAQIKVASQLHKDTFGIKPNGLWLAECGYNPGDDEILKENNIRYFFVDSHAVIYASHRPKYGIFAPLYCPSGVAAFGRDIESSRQVWSSFEGYPGDYYYREFYRDVGYDLDFDYIRPYIHESGMRKNVGIKYYRITGAPLDQKKPYIPQKALERVEEHSGNFMFNREKQVEYLNTLMDRPPIIVSPYDAELFGHWWYEGPLFLEYVLRKVYRDSRVLELITPPEYLQIYTKNQMAIPSYSSWGYKGYAEFWLNDTNDWIYKHLHEAADIMVQLAEEFKWGAPSSLVKRSLNQACRELLLAQSSDWAFIMKTGTVVDYATKRTNEHCQNLFTLNNMIRRNEIDINFLANLEYRNNIFPNIDYRVYL